MNQEISKGTYDISFPTGDSSFASANFRNNFLSIYAGDLLHLRPLAHDIPDMSIMVLGKDHNKFFNNIYYGDNNQRLSLTSGDSSTMSAPSANPRIDTVYIDGSGDIIVQAGVEATSPIIPNIPSGDAIPICAIYHLTTSERIVNYADKDTFSGDSYIYKDIRPLYVIPRATESISALELKKDENIINLAKTNFKIQAYHTSARYNLKDLYIDSFQDNSGIDVGMSSGYQYRGTPNYDVTVATSALELDYMEYSSDALIQAEYVSDASGTLAWTERQPQTTTSINWYAAASDADGSHLIAGAYEKRLWTSADYGVNWTERRPAGDAGFRWRPVASNSDGSRLIAGISTGRLYISANYGVDWAETQPVGDANGTWYCCASDADGSHLIAGENNSRLWTSADYGVNWTERRPAGDVNFYWRSVASDSDGSHLIACAYLRRLWTSDDYGVTWTERKPAGDANKNWHCVASDSDGSHLIAGISTGRLYTSSNYGVDWTETQPAGNVGKAWRYVASDADGSHLIAVYWNGRVYTSSDYGANWTEQRPDGDNNRAWHVAAIDSDGSHFFVGSIYNVSLDRGRLYTGATGALDLQCYSESTIKTQGDYSLKLIAKQTESLNNTLTRTVSPTIDLSGITQIKYGIYSASRTGSNIKISIHDSGGTTTEHTANISSTGAWETQTWDISGVADADKNTIDSIIITIVNADADNTVYIDNMYAETTGGGAGTVISIPITGDSVPDEAMIIKEDTVGTGNLKYYISRHSGDYTLVTPNVMTDISAQPSGQVMRTKVVISGDSELENISLAW